MSMHRRLAALGIVTALVLCGCGDKGGKGAGGSEGAATTGVPGGKPARVAAVVADDLGRLVPADAVGVVYVPSLDALEAKWKTIVGAVDSDAASEVSVGKMLENLAGPAAGQVDRSRPAAVAFTLGAGPKPKPSFTIILPVLDGAAAKAAFGEVPPGKPAPVVLGKYLALSESPDVKPAATASALVKDLPAGDVTARVDLARVIGAYRDKIDEAMGQMGERAGGSDRPGAPPGLASAREMMKGLTEVLKTLLDSAERLDLTVRVEGTTADLDIAFTAKAGSALDRPKSARGDVASVAAALPRDYPIVALVGVSMAELGEWANSLSDAYFMAVPEQQRAALKKMMARSNEMYALLGNEAAVGLSLGAAGIEEAVVMSAKDPKAFLAKMDEAMKGEYAAALAEMGMAFEPLPVTTTAGVEVRGWAMKFDWVKMMAASGQEVAQDSTMLERMQKSVESVFGPGGFRMRMAIVGDRIVAVAGGADDLMEKAITAAKSPGKPPASLSRALAKAGERPSFVVSLDLRETIADLLGFVAKMMPEEGGREMPTLPSGGPVPVAVYGTGAGREYWGGLSVDVGAAASLVKSLLEQVSPKREPHEPVPFPDDK